MITSNSLVAWCVGRAAILTLTLSLPLAAQGSTWIVDAANGPGTNFTTVQAALASVQVNDGDQLLVRAGSYGPCTTAKGVTILGEPGAKITGTPAQAALTVSGLAAGRTFVLDRIVVEHALAREGIVLQGNPGRVHLDDVTISALALNNFRSLSLSACALVTANRCAITGSTGGIQCVDSTLLLSQVQAQGFDNMGTTPALSCTNSTVWLSEFTGIGGKGVQNRSPAAPAVAGTQTHFVIARSSLTAGQVGIAFGGPSAIYVESGSLRIDPSVTLVPFPGAAPISAPGSLVTMTPTPFLSLTSAPPGGTLGFAVQSAANDSLFLALALPGPELALPFGTTWLDLGTLIPLAVGPQDPSGRFGLLLTVPNQPSLRGLLLVSQAANLAAASNILDLTNPVFFSLH